MGQIARTHRPRVRDQIHGLFGGRSADGKEDLLGRVAAVPDQTRKERRRGEELHCQHRGDGQFAGGHTQDGELADGDRAAVQRKDPVGMDVHGRVRQGVESNGRVQGAARGQESGVEHL